MASFVNNSSCVAIAEIKGLLFRGGGNVVSHFSSLCASTFVSVIQFSVELVASEADVFSVTVKIGLVVSAQSKV